MMQSDAILAHISRHIILKPREERFFLSLLESRNLKKKEMLQKAGEPCTTFSYVNKGALRAYYYGDDDKESTIMFAVADWWITDMPCFVNQERAMISIEAITNCEVLQLTYEKMEALYLKVPKFERFFRILMQHAYVREQLRMLQRLSQPAEMRYNAFLKKYSAIAQQVPQKNIASYLGITPEFLSVIRSKERRGMIS